MHSEPFVKLKPVFKEYLWGGAKLKALFGAPEQRVAEAWLLSAHPDGPSVIAEGKDAGMPFPEYLSKEGAGSAFPILIKLIDSAQKLSVQVHPDDAYARIQEHDNGKNELWLVLESEPDAYLYIGFNRNVTQEEVRRRVQDGTIEAVLHKIPTHAGDMVYIPAGTVHAIGAGNLILEVQQSSNATYRLYDYNRRDARGELRPLHLNKALDVLLYRKYESSEITGDAQSAQCKYFKVTRHMVHGSYTLPMAGETFASVVCVEGEGSLKRHAEQTALRRGDSLYLPAAGGPAEVEGDLNIVVTHAAVTAP